MSALRVLNDAARGSMHSNERTVDFYTFGRLLLAARGDLPLALRHAETGREASPRVVEVLRSAVSSGTASDSSWAAALSPYRTISDGFVDSLRSASVFDAMMPDMVRVPMQTKIAMIVASLAASAVNEGMVKPLAQMVLDAPSVAPRKVTGLLAVSDEVAKFGTAASVLLFNSALRNSVAVATDAVFLAALYAGTTPTASSGTTATAFVTDLRTLLNSVAPLANSKPYVIVSPSSARALSLFGRDAGAPAFPNMGLAGGELLPGLPCLVSDQLPADANSPSDKVAMLVDASGVLADPGQVVLDSSREALLQLDSSPDSPETAATVPISLFQRGMVAMKAERAFGFSIARSSPPAVASLSGVAW